MILADSHVHIYDCFELSFFLDSAASNFALKAQELRLSDAFSAVLFLTEGKNEFWFHRLHEYVEKRISSSGWTFHSTEESCSIYAQQGNGKGLFIIAGRQIVTAEKLEVLSIVSEKPISDGLSLEETVKCVIERGGIPVIPWGTGKWFGKRGRILKKYLECYKEQNIFLGDNGGRPLFWPQPSLFKLSRNKGIRILPGSDPLPFASECHKPGSYGFMLKQNISKERPAADMKNLLYDQSIMINAYGKRESMYRFLRNQIGMQIAKRKKGDR